ncbi:MAG: ABC transporter ATP-binding protein [Acidobacteriota bacterium]|nr:ABC transporter ATP-binding protein [Acidobacteriota bacterium]MDH3786617.1 ABC transporter ATP-binding protein [Acidobacteriota bacterium]
MSHGVIALSVCDLHVRRGKRQVIAGLSLEIRRGEVLALLGPNGCGKTTLFHVLTGLLRPDSGAVTLAGNDLRAHESTFLASTGVVFQDPALDNRFTAKENLLMAASLYGIRGGSARKRVDGLLRDVGLSDRADDIVSTFSGGMRRRVEIARALIHEPQFLLLDEPTTGLDEGAFRRVWSDLLALRQKRDVTILYTTHRGDEAEQSDRVAIMDKGSIIACDSPDNLRASVRGDLLWLEADDPESVGHQLSDGLKLESRIVGNRLALRLDEAHRWIPRITETLEAGCLRSVEMRRTGLAEVFLDRTGQRLDIEEDR